MYIEELNSSRFAEEIKGVDTVVLPIGTIEAHGPHCSLSTDNLIPAELATRINQVLGDKLMIAPGIHYGHTWGLASFPGTINVDADIFAAYVLAVGAEYIRQGFKYIVLLNGHGGNISSLNTVTEKLSDLGAKCITLNWWVDYRTKIGEIVSGIGHAGEDETSLVLAIDEKLADVSLASDHQIDIPPNIKFKESARLAYPDAQSGAGSKATREKGLAIYDLLLKAMVEDIRVLWSY